MGFSEAQLRALARPVPRTKIRSRMSKGKELHYIEGWYALSQANRIFGPDGWDRETVEARCANTRNARDQNTAVYTARVRISVRTEGGTLTVREGHGTGEAFGQSAGEVHDRALKAAETDATKRALATFGKAFGLALYAGRKPPTNRRHATRQVGEPKRRVEYEGGSRAALKPKRKRRLGWSNWIRPFERCKGCGCR